MRTSAILVSVLILGAVAASADEVMLKNGGKVVGIAHEKGDKIMVEVGAGVVAFPKEDVLTVKRTRTPLHEYKERLEKLEKVEKAEASDHYRLAVFCKENKLDRYSRVHFRRAIEIDPEHEMARRELGYRLYKGRWMTQDEVLEERGFVKFEGKWMTPAEVELIRKHRIEMEERRMAMEEERRRREEEEKRDLAELQKKHYERMLQLQYERERARIYERPYYRYPRYYSYRSYPYYDYRYGLIPSLDVLGYLGIRHPMATPRTEPVNPYKKRK